MNAQNPPLPVLYSFRRCPYAIRARMALRYANVAVELREILLKDKPGEMLAVSKKGTVPVLVCTDGRVIDESLDIMHWALDQGDPGHWRLAPENPAMENLIKGNDFEFKPWLDKYKYAVRFPEQGPEHYREQCMQFLLQLEKHLNRNQFLTGDIQRLADVAIFPFVRQFNGVEPGWLGEAGLTRLENWLTWHLESELFLGVMKKYPVWNAARSNGIRLWGT